jgi:hypothetical protein
MSRDEVGEERFEAIEAYLMGRATAAERAEVEAAIQADPAFAQEVQAQRESVLAVEMAGFRRTLRQVMQADAGMRTESSRSTWWKYAAAAVLLVGAAAFWLSRPPLQERLYAEYHVTDPGLPVPMSIVAEPEFHDAMVDYKMGAMGTARAKWSRILAREPGNDTLLYYIGCSLLEMDSAASAAPYFKLVAADPASRFRTKAEWYLFLVDLRTGNTTQLDSFQLDQDPIYGPRVKAIRAKLGR